MIVNTVLYAAQNNLLILLDKLLSDNIDKNFTLTIRDVNIPSNNKHFYEIRIRLKRNNKVHSLYTSCVDKLNIFSRYSITCSDK